MMKVYLVVLVMSGILVFAPGPLCQVAAEPGKPASGEAGRLSPQQLRTLDSDALDKRMHVLEKEHQEYIKKIEAEARQRHKQRQAEFRNKYVYPEALQAAGRLITANRHEQALPILEKLAEAGFQPAKTYLYLGMVAAKQGRYDEALTYFDQAGADPETAQEAKYQRSLVLAAQGKLRDSREALQETIALNPLTPLAGLSRGYVATLEQSLREQQRLRLGVGTGVAYDSNVTLQPDATQSAQFISGRGDLLYYQHAELELSLFPARTYDVLLQYFYYQNFHRRLTAYDLLTHTVGPMFTYTFSQGKLWVPCNYNYTDLQSDKYYTAFNIAPLYLHMLNPQVGLEAGLRFTQSYYWLPVYIQNFDRTGPQGSATFGAYYFFPKRQGYLQARFGFTREFSNGSDYVNCLYRLLLAASYNPLERLNLKAGLELGIQPYDNNWVDGTTQSYPKRLDKMLLLRLDMTVGLYKGLEFNTHYYFETYDSNISLFTYNRHLVGCQLVYRY